MRVRSTMLAAGVWMAHLGCSAGPGAVASLPTASASTPRPAGGAADDALVAVARIHGGAGPWVVAGYRMGEFALGALDVEHGSFDLEVTHFAPREVQFTCIADGAAAATGASLGKLNLALAEAPRAGTQTTYRRKSTGEAITLRPTASFAARFTNVPRGELAEAGRVVASLRDDEIFVVVAR